MHSVTFVEPLPGHKIRLCFSDGLAGEVDLSDMVGKGVFASWRDPDEFGKVFVDTDTHTVAWPGGIDLCPDALYQEVASKQKAA